MPLLLSERLFVYLHKKCSIAASPVKALVAQEKAGSLTMAQMHSSATEHALENQRVGGLQIRVALICGLIQMCDGYDVGTIGWSVPSLTRAWQIAPSAFALAFLWSNIGLMAGALAAGPIGDRIGRKPLLLISLALFGLASLASAFSPSLGFLAGTRFFTGAGIAGGFAGSVALTGDYTPHRLRDDDHADLHRGAARRLCRRSSRLVPTGPGLWLADHLHHWRRL
jgi:hypothetical protein